MSADTYLIFIKISDVQMISGNDQPLIFQKEDHFFRTVMKNFFIVLYFQLLLSKGLELRHILRNFPGHDLIVRKPIFEQNATPFFLHPMLFKIILCRPFSVKRKKSYNICYSFYIQASEDYLYLRFLAASDFFLRLTLGFS